MKIIPDLVVPGTHSQYCSSSSAKHFPWKLNILYETSKNKIRILIDNIRHSCGAAPAAYLVILMASSHILSTRGHGRRCRDAGQLYPITSSVSRSSVKRGKKRKLSKKSNTVLLRHPTSRLSFHFIKKHVIKFP